MQLYARLGDITAIATDAIVNAANEAMRGGGGVDGAIHAAGGPAILEDCIRRFPNGLPTGQAGWTTAGELAARWVIHTVGPNYAAGNRDRDLLVDCYRSSLVVADELGVSSIAFPLISTGVYGWPLSDAVAVAVSTLATAETQVEECYVVAFSAELYDLVSNETKHLE
ncbi:MAG: O-acetyl-ADP-ribose deacetylase [Acidimicrobiia bacterium]